MPNNNIHNIITPAMTRREARTALLRAGYKFIAGGSFASVWKAPDADRVVKVTKPDPGADATVEASRALPDNPHLPTIYSVTPLFNGGTAIETEYLLPAHDVYYDFIDSDEWMVLVEEGGDIDTPTPLGAALRALSDASRTHRVTWDEHEENVMARPDGTVVLTDLLYSPRALTDACNYDGTIDREGHRRGSAHSLAAARAHARRVAAA